MLTNTRLQMNLRSSYGETGKLKVLRLLKAKQYWYCSYCYCYYCIPFLLYWEGTLTVLLTGKIWKLSSILSDQLVVLPTINQRCYCRCLKFITFKDAPTERSCELESAFNKCIVNAYVFAPVTLMRWLELKYNHHHMDVSGCHHSSNTLSSVSATAFSDTALSDSLTTHIQKVILYYPKWSERGFYEWYLDKNTIIGQSGYSFDTRWDDASLVAPILKITR